MFVTFSCSILSRSGTAEAVRKLPMEDNNSNPVEIRASGKATEEIKRSRISTSRAR